MQLNAIPAFSIKYVSIIAGTLLLSLSSPAQCPPDSAVNTMFTISNDHNYFHQYDCGDTVLYAFAPTALFDSLNVMSLYDAQRIACTQFGMKAVQAHLYVHDDPAQTTWKVRGNYSSKLGGRGYGNATVKYTAIIIDTNGQAKAVKRKHRSLQDF